MSMVIGNLSVRIGEDEDVRLRMAAPADARALAELRWDWRIAENPNRSAVEGHAAFIERFTVFAADGLASGRWIAWVADDSGRLRATAWVYRVPKVPSPGTSTRDFGYMTNVYARPESRDRGIGSDLMRAVTAWAHEVNLEMIIVWPGDRSVRWYHRHGFVPAAEMLELEIQGYEE